VSKLPVNGSMLVQKIKIRLLVFEILNERGRDGRRDSIICLAFHSEKIFPRKFGSQINGIRVWRYIENFENNHSIPPYIIYNI